MLAGEKEYKVKTGNLFTKEMLVDEILGFIQKYNLQPDAIGIAIPGLVKNNEIIDCDVLPNLNGWNPDNDCRHLPFNIQLFNDVQAALAEEYHDFDENFTGGVIMVGTAVGAAFITNGRLLTGAHGWAGEFGYFPFVLDGKIQRLDEIVGGSYLAKKSGLSAQEMYNQALAGNPQIIETIKNGGHHLGIAIAGLINLLNPNSISVGGGTIELPHYWQELLAGARENVIAAMWTDGMIKKVDAGYKVVSLGAGRLAKQNSGTQRH